MKILYADMTAMMMSIPLPKFHHLILSNGDYVSGHTLFQFHEIARLDYVQ